MKEIHLWGVKQNNLKNIEVKVPLGKLTVICGPSGSGKSSLAFETLFAEGQRRFIESMSNYARQFLNKAPKPNIEGVNNIPPAIAIEQKNSIISSRSTVGTTTEITDYLRLLFEKIGEVHCPNHHIKMEKQSITEATDKVLQSFEGERGYILVEIGSKSRIVEGKKLHSLLLQDGYLRIYLQNKKQDNIVEISDPKVLKKGLPKDTFYLVIDRMAFQKEEQGRLTDSLSHAYEASIKYNSGVILRSCCVITADGKKLQLSEDNSCSICNYVPPPISSRLFSFNSPIGACPTCKGFGNLLEIDENKVVPNSNLSLAQGALHPFTMPSAEEDKKKLFAYCKKKKINLHASWKDLPEDQRKILWNGDKDFFGVKGLFKYLEQIKYKMHVRVFISRYRSPFLCSDCNGTRLRKEAHYVFVQGKNITEYSSMTIEELYMAMKNLELTKTQNEVALEVLKQIRSRLNFLLRVGVHYLNLNRETKTLSGGEYQRLILANQLGMELSQTLYVLDEPTVGLHPRDNDRLISVLKDLRDLGNTLVVVEHDHDVIKNAENIIEMGPGSGYLGGEIIFSGSKNDFFYFENSNTAKYLKPYTANNNRIKLIIQNCRPVDMQTYRYKIRIEGARGHNLKNLTVEFPLNRLVAVTGVSGSGKSTLVAKTLFPLLEQALNLDYKSAKACDNILGVDNIKNVLMVDQSSIGKSIRSSPITYLKTFDSIRTIMASTSEARIRGYTPGTFSLNVDGGRCPVCKGTGFEEIDMMFMDNIVIPCDVCDGKKYRPEILEILYKRKNIFEILSMTIAEAMNFFVAHPHIRKPLSVLKEVGLDYLQLGQPAKTLSGGESQRLKIAKELSQVQQRSTLYILDEPTKGLHFREIELLMNVLNKLIAAGGSVIVVEHNQDVILGSDYIIDLGPEAGEKGGHIVATGSPEEIMANQKSLTGQFLKSYVTYMNSKGAEK